MSNNKTIQNLSHKQIQNMSREQLAELMSREQLVELAININNTMNEVTVWLFKVKRRSIRKKRLMDWNTLHKKMDITNRLIGSEFYERIQFYHKGDDIYYNIYVDRDRRQKRKLNKGATKYLSKVISNQQWFGPVLFTIEKLVKLDGLYEFWGVDIKLTPREYLQKLKEAR